MNVSIVSRTTRAATVSSCAVVIASMYISRLNPDGLRRPDAATFLWLPTVKACRSNTVIFVYRIVSLKCPVNIAKRCPCICYKGSK